MIGKREWFKIRKYGGWGMVPATKEGWIYIGVFILTVVLITNLPLTLVVKNALIAIAIAVIVIDALDFVLRGPKDERDAALEAIAERNAGWSMIATLIVAAAYEALGFAPFATQIGFNAWFMVVLAVGAVVKGLSYLYLERK